MEKAHRWTPPTTPSNTKSRIICMLLIKTIRRVTEIRKALWRALEDLFTRGKIGMGDIWLEHDLRASLSKLIWYQCRIISTRAEPIIRIGHIGSWKMILWPIRKGITTSSSFQNIRARRTAQHPLLMRKGFRKYLRWSGLTAMECLKANPSHIIRRAARLDSRTCS